MIRTIKDYLTYYLNPIRISMRISGTEWDENWKSWPHCNGQAGCWMHVSAQWCGCVCRWCRIARKVRRNGKVL